MSNSTEFVDLTSDHHLSPELRPGKPSKEQIQMTTINTITLIECSNACPFVQHYGMFRCFYCQEKYPGIPSLREHIAQEHVIPSVKLRLDTLHKGTFVMVDITDLCCKICNKSTPNLYNLKKHLANQHQKLIYLNESDGLIPFMLPGEIFNCLICGQQFQLFQLLTQHMNIHYGDKVCNVCGAAFLSHGRLKSHKVIHKVREVGTFKCESCEKVFITDFKRKAHRERVHEKKPRYRCPKCPENFTEYYLRITHMYNVHDIDPPEYKCELCGNGYRRPHLVALHMKKCHVRDSASGDLSTGIFLDDELDADSKEED